MNKKQSVTVEASEEAQAWLAGYVSQCDRLVLDPTSTTDGIVGIGRCPERAVLVVEMAGAWRETRCANHAADVNGSACERVQR